MFYSIQDGVKFYFKCGCLRTGKQLFIAGLLTLDVQLDPCTCYEL